MTNEYELADDNRADLIYEKSDLLAPLLPGMVEPPHAMLISDDEQDYYRGKTVSSGPVEQAGGPSFPPDPAETAEVNPPGEPGEPSIVPGEDPS
jgi:hypothetical protein